MKKATLIAFTLTAAIAVSGCGRSCPDRPGAGTSEEGGEGAGKEGGGGGDRRSPPAVPGRLRRRRKEVRRRPAAEAADRRPRRPISSLNFFGARRSSAGAFFTLKNK